MNWRCKLVLAVHLGIVGGLIVNHADAAVTTATHTSWALRSGTTQLATFPSQSACEEEARKRPVDEGATRTTGSRVYSCVTTYNVIATFRANPSQPVTCPAPPPPQTVACPTGTTGTWESRATVGPAPLCQVTWAPSSPPSGACTPTSPPSSTATLTWTPPTRNTDGSPLTDLSGYFLRYGTNRDELTQLVQIRGMTRWTVENLEPGTYYFTVSAYNTDRIESAQSNMVTKVVR